MLTIRDTQMQALSDDVFARFRRAMAERLRTLLRPAPGAEEAREMVDRAFERAAGYGITALGDLEGFTGLMGLLGPAFDVDERLSWAGGILRNPDLHPSSKVALVARRAGGRAADAGTDGGA